MIYASPSRWKRYYGLNRDGEASRRRALGLFPASAASFARKKDHHRAEAALLARWAVPRDLWLADPSSLGVLENAAGLKPTCIVKLRSGSKVSRKRSR